MRFNSKNSFKSLDKIHSFGKDYKIFNLKNAEKNGLDGISKLPKSLKVLLENLLRYEDDITDMHMRFVQLVMEMKKDGHDPLAIAGCMLAGAVQIYQTELGEDTAFQLLDQIANGGDNDVDFDLDVDKETIH